MNPATAQTKNFFARHFPHRKARRFGIAFGSGGARGWAHLGVLRYLEERGVHPGCVCGTSIGSIAAAVCSLGKMEAFCDFAERLNTMRSISSFFDMGLSRGGLLSGEKAIETLQSILGNPLIEEMPIPFAAVATDLETGTPVVFQSGPLMDAIRASISIPVIFVPVYTATQVLIDGAYSNPVPVSVARDVLGASEVLAVNVESDKPCPYHDAEEVSPAKQLLRKLLPSSSDTMHSLEVMHQSTHVLTRNLISFSLAGAPPDYLVEPPVGGISTMQFERARDAIRAGYEEARKVLENRAI